MPNGLASFSLTTKLKNAELPANMRWNNGSGMLWAEIRPAFFIALQMAAKNHNFRTNVETLEIPRFERSKLC